MNEAEFRAQLEAEGYEVVDVTWDAGRINESHAHEFDARLMCVEGSVEITTAAGTAAYQPGDRFEVPAGTPHREVPGPQGARLVAGRKY